MTVNEEGDQGNGGSLAPSNGSTEGNGSSSAIRAIELVQVLWRKVDDHPVSYVPSELDRTHPTGANDGEWIIDHQSGANFFVPFQGVGKATYDHVLASIPTNGQPPELAKNLNVAGVDLPSVPPN
tara:strand:+ start:18346 stop:18720 length:375 start_codon:yes stop_codon:yes gene_type:complete